MAYRGTTVKIPLGNYGLLTDIPPDKQPPGSLILANNITFEKGSLEKAPGAIQWNTNAVSTGIVGVYHWRPTDVQAFFIAVTSDGNIYRGQDRTFGSPINATVAALTPNCVFAEGGAESAGRAKKLFLFTGGATSPLVLAGGGTAFTTFASPNPDWTSSGSFPRFGLVHRNSLWAFAGQISYASSTDNHEDFSNTSAAFVDPVYAGEGGELRGACVFKGRLFCFKDGGLAYILNDQDINIDNWYWQKIASNFGLAAPNAVREVLDDMIAGNPTGTFSSFAASQKLGGVEASDIVQDNFFEAFLRANTSKVGITQMHTLWYSEKKQFFATYRSCYKTTNDMLLMFDYARSQIRPTFWKKGTPQCLGLYRDVNQIDRPMYGDANGALYLMDSEDRLEGGATYTGEFQTPHWDFSFANQALSAVEKHFDFLAVHYRPESVGMLFCDYFIDGHYVETISFPMVRYERPELGTLVLDTDRLAQQNEETCIHKLCGSGRTISFRFYNAGSARGGDPSHGSSLISGNQSFQIPAISVLFRTGGNKAQSE